MSRSLTAWILALSAVVFACGEGVAADATGEEIFLQVCARCHNENLSGGLGPPLVGEESPATDRPKSFIVQSVEQGIGRMPSFGGTLTDEQIDRVADYVLEQQGR